MARPGSSTPDMEALAEQAAHWIVRLSDEDPAERECARRELNAWKRADARHAVAAEAMESLIGQMHDLRTQTAGDGRPARAAIEAALARGGRQRRGRRLAVSLALALALAFCIPAALILRIAPPAYLLADLRTATGQWRTVTLPDGTNITLDSASAVNIHYDTRRRAIELVQGNILVAVAKDASRPFLVDTIDGRVRALGTHFVVARARGATVLSMIESRTAVQTAAQRADGVDDQVKVKAGERVRITQDAVSLAETIDPVQLSEAWRHHQLVVNDQPLADVLDALSRHRRGLIYYNRQQIAPIRVSAVLPLDTPDQALKLLQTSFPALRVRFLTDYVVLVDAPGSKP